MTSSGFSRLMLGFRNEAGLTRYNNASTVTGTTSLCGGDNRHFPQFSGSGTYTLYDVTTFDRNGNVKYYTQQEISALTTATLTVISVSDTAAPKLSKLSFSPSAIDTSTGPATVQVVFAGSDDLSGFRQIILAFRSTTGETQYNSGSTVNGTTSFSGVTTVEFPKFSAKMASTASSM